MRRVSLFAIALAATCASAASASSGYIAASTFTSSTEGWMMFRHPQATMATPSFLPSHGNPDGYIRMRDNNDGWYFFQAPAPFLGDITPAYGHELQYDIFNCQGYGPVDPGFDVVIEGAGMTIQYDFSGIPDTNWSTRLIPLIAEAGWVHSDTLLPVSEAEMLSVMGSTTALRILGEFRSGFDYMGLDNVYLIPGPSALALAGLALMSRSRRRR